MIQWLVKLFRPNRVVVTWNMPDGWTVVSGSCSVATYTWSFDGRGN